MADRAMGKIQRTASSGRASLGGMARRGELVLNRECGKERKPKTGEARTGSGRGEGAVKGGTLQLIHCGSRVSPLREGRRGEKEPPKEKWTHRFKQMGKRFK